MDMQSQSATTEEAYHSFFDNLSEDMQNCIQNCSQCAQVCEQMILTCLAKGGPHADPTHIRLLQDCANICETSARFMLRGSSFHVNVCGVCSQICGDCAEECEQFDGHEQMLLCAKICRACAFSCRQMSQSH